MQYTQRQKTVSENIVTIHETGKLSGKSYGTVTNVRGDPGGLTYGKHQVTINSGGLNLMLSRYVAAPGAQFAQQIGSILPAIRAKDTVASSQASVRTLLQQAGNDPVMAQVQDKYFDDQYWMPAVKFCDAKGLDLALALAVAYDSTIHGSLYRVDKRIQQGLSTKQWILAYVEARRNWMATHSILILRRCTYRMDTFRALHDANNFGLDPIVMAHGMQADAGVGGAQQTTLQQPPPQPAAVAVPVGITTQRILDLGDKGDDVVELQQMLTRIGYNVGVCDGDFGQKTDNAVKAIQALYGLLADGIVGPATWRVLDQVDD